MTLHNLDDNIAWLLRQRVTPSADVHATIHTSSRRAPEGVDGENLDSEELQPAGGDRRAAAGPHINRDTIAVNVEREERDFVRPSLPSTGSIATVSNPPQSSRFPRGTEYGSMGKLKSDSRSARPGLMVQRQLATPSASIASTIGTSSLRDNYDDLLKGNNGTPSSRPQAFQGLSRPRPNLQTPQTPRQDPLSTVGRFIDLTGVNDSTTPKSDSSEVSMFMEPLPVRDELSAAGPEPLPRKSKKRKSDDISSLGPVKRMNNCNIPLTKIKTDENDDGFVDIDDFEDCIPPSGRLDRASTKNTAFGSLKATVERENSIDEFQEGYEITETISRVETRTRKSISRVPPLSGADQFRSNHVVQVPETPATQPEIQSNRSPVLHHDLGSPSLGKSPLSNLIQTVPKPRIRPSRAIVQDSEDEDQLSPVGKKASCSPMSIKNTPRATTRSPKLGDVPTFSQTHHKGRSVNDSNPRVGSPLRPISKNLLVQQDSVPSPFQQDSPTQVFLPPKNQVRQLSQLTPNSSLAADDKKIVQLYLAHPSAINVYHQRVTHLLTQSALVSMEYFDRGETVPTHMKEERLALVKKNEAYKRLSGLGESYKNLLAEKKVVASQLSELVNLNDDSTLQEERLASISQDLRNIEKDLGNLLQTSGAIEDGFGTGLYILASGATSSSRIHDNHIPLPSGSSLIGSAQMIEQTQFPSLPGNPTSQITRLASTSRDRSAIISANVRDVSPSPVRSYRPTSQANEGSVRLKEARNGPQRSLKQPDFYHEPTPVDYDFDEDNEAFEQLVKDDQKLQYESRINGSKPSTEVPREIEENYGDSDFDDDMEGVAQEVERRHSGMAPPRNQDKQQALSENVRNISESSRKSLSKPRKDMYSHIDLENSGLFKHPWSNDVKKVLKERFRLRGFRYHQLEAINATLSGQDAFVLMPTGGGKSLCYQLPAIVQSGKHKGVTIVISPLLSLMNDQVQHLRALSIRAATVNSETSPEERHEVLANLNETHPEQYIQLLYLTPEMVVKSNNMSNILTRLHKNKKLARFVIDEAHCVSQWGHDFRKDYVALGLVRQKYPNVPIMALTATATENVKVDVMHNLGMGKCPEFAQSFNRPNLYYEVRSKQKKKAQDILKEMVDLVTKKYKGQTGIIYTLSRKNCEDIASKLSTEHKVKVHHFHAALSAEEKTKVQKDWQSGKLQVVVATIAFGMGIDKPDVRFVIHHMIPKSLEGYYQETGRAGRDGKKSGCYLFYGYQDTTMLKRFIHDSEGSYEQKERQRKMLQQMIRYCEERSECRRVQVLDYFGEKFAREDCQNTCDNCKSDATFEDVDFTKYAQAALQVVKKVCKDDVTLLHCVDVVRGVSNSKVKSFGHSEISEFGFAKDLTRGEVERVFYRLVMENALREENIINRSGFAASYMRLGPNCRGFITGQRKVLMQVQISRSPQPRQKSTKSAEHPPSTMLTSPISPTKRTKIPKNQLVVEEDEDDDSYGENDFVVSDDEGDEENALEIIRQPKRQLEMREPDFGIPITADSRLDHLPLIHQGIVHNFVHEARSLEERIRNNAGLRKPLFTETQLREMAIDWTLNLVAMKRIPGINIERVQTYGKQFIPLVKQFFDNYKEMMDNSEDRDIDSNHQNVIDLCSDEEAQAEEDAEYGSSPDSDDEAAIQEAEQHSVYFQNPAKAKPSARKFNSGSKKNYRAGSTSSGSKGQAYKRKSTLRKSYGSASGASVSGVRKRKSFTKKPRANKSNSGNTSKISNLTKEYGYSGGSRGGGMGGGSGISMMPT